MAGGRALAVSPRARSARGGSFWGCPSIQPQFRSYLPIWPPERTLSQSRNSRAVWNVHAGGAKEPSDRTCGACLLAGLLVPALSGMGSHPSSSKICAIFEEVAPASNGSSRSATLLGLAPASSPSAAPGCWRPPPACTALHWLVIMIKVHANAFILMTRRLEKRRNRQWCGGARFTPPSPSPPPPQRQGATLAARRPSSSGKTAEASMVPPP